MGVVSQGPEKYRLAEKYKNRKEYHNINYLFFP